VGSTPASPRLRRSALNVKTSRERDDETIRRPEHVDRRLVGPARTPSLVHHNPHARQRRRDVPGYAIEADLVQPGEPLRKRHGGIITGIADVRRLDRVAQNASAAEGTTEADMDRADGRDDAPAGGGVSPEVHGDRGGDAGSRERLQPVG
jgi:hypothetical protein